MREKIKELKTALEEFKRLVDMFPKAKREEVVFDQWSLKGILSHLINWMEHDFDCFDALENNQEPLWKESIDDFNTEGVNKLENAHFDDVHREYLQLTKLLIQRYSSLTESIWEKKYWAEREHTPRTFIEDDINHYKQEHIPQLKNFLTHQAIL